MGFLDFTKSTFIGVIDCSFISKSGKKTFGLDQFWSGVANITKRGLEISVLGCNNVNSARAYCLERLKHHQDSLSRNTANLQQVNRNGEP